MRPRTKLPRPGEQPRPPPPKTKLRTSSATSSTTSDSLPTHPTSQEPATPPTTTTPDPKPHGAPAPARGPPAPADPEISATQATSRGLTPSSDPPNQASRSPVWRKGFAWTFLFVDRRWEGGLEHRQVSPALDRPTGHAGLASAHRFGEYRFFSPRARAVDRSITARSNTGAGACRRSYGFRRSRVRPSSTAPCPRRRRRSRSPRSTARKSSSPH